MVAGFRMHLELEQKVLSKKINLLKLSFSYALGCLLKLILLDICGIEATPLGGWEVESGRNV